MVKDIISLLPDELLHHILSFLPIEKAVATSCLSTRWKRVYSTLPYLTFQLLGYGPRIDKLLDSIDKKFFNGGPRHNLCIQRFHLVPYDTRDPVVKKYVERWIELLTQSKIKEMIIKFPEKSYFPQTILSVKSITVLYLSHCKLWETGSNISNVELVCLKKLWLKEVIVKDCLIQKILVTSLDLEEITLEYCEGLTSLRITGLVGLKMLKLILIGRDVRFVEIDAPSLVHYSHCMHWLPDPCEIKFTNCSNLRELILTPPEETDEELNKTLSVLNNLKYLKIPRFSEQLKSVCVSSKSLTTLICDCGRLSKVEIKIPNLQYLELHAKYIFSMSLIAPPKREAKLSFIELGEIRPEGYIGLLNILRELSGSEKVTLIVNLRPDEIIPEEWKVHFARVEYLTRFRNLWLDANIGLFDFLYMIFPNLHIEVPWCTAKIRTSTLLEEVKVKIQRLGHKWTIKA